MGSASAPQLNRTPYLSEPYGSTGGYMGPHPMNEARQLVVSDKDIMQASLKHVLALRKRPGANGLTSSQSLTYVPQERGAIAQDYASLVSLKTDRRKHVRTAIYPQQKYVMPASTSMEIG